MRAPGGERLRSLDDDRRVSAGRYSKIGPFPVRGREDGGRTELEWAGPAPSDAQAGGARHCTGLDRAGPADRAGRGFRRLTSPPAQAEGVWPGVQRSLRHVQEGNAAVRRGWKIAER